MAIAAQDSATKASAANTSLMIAQSTVEQGQVAINTLTEGITVLQKGSAQIVQKMKTLGEFVGLAEQFVQDQGQIASLTQVLAINATLVAARAAEQRDPKQFIGVAREFEAIAGQVNNLANQTNDGLAVLQQRTAQIQSVVSAIDLEVQSLGGLVEGFNSGVEQSQSAFYDIQKVTELVVNAGQSITESSIKIADAAEATVEYMSAIDKLATETATLTRSTSLQAEQMGTLAQKLLTGIQFFRLPDTLMSSLDDTGIKPEPQTKPQIKTLDIPAEVSLEYL
jgi:twitching motility protein PilJ